MIDALMYDCVYASHPPPVDVTEILVKLTSATLTCYSYIFWILLNA
jgi:hypothetical protein